MVEIGTPASVLADAGALREMAEALTKRDVVISRGVVAPVMVHRLRAYLSSVGRGSMPQWHPIRPGCPNFHRINREDRRSDVRGLLHQFSFFPWNDDPFGLFDLFRDIFRLRNKLCGAAPDAFLSPSAEDGAIARFSVQFYPRGGGYMNAHKDPVGAHQLAVPILAMSAVPEDFAEGGLYVGEGDRRIEVDTLLRPGDVVWFHPQEPHGVARVDPATDLDWTAFMGRWSAIFAVNNVRPDRETAGVEHRP